MHVATQKDAPAFTSITSNFPWEGGARTKLINLTKKYGFRLSVLMLCGTSLRINEGIKAVCD